MVVEAGAFALALPVDVLAKPAPEGHCAAVTSNCTGSIDATGGGVGGATAEVTGH